MDAEKMNQVPYEKTLAIPLYPENARYAKTHSEIDLFRASHKANIACRDAIDAAIRTGFDGMHLPETAAKDVLAEFGPERVAHVLAATLLDKLTDERFSDRNLVWAKSVPMFDTGTRHYDYTLQSHSIKLNEFVTLVRKELAAEKERRPQKPFIKGRLAENPVPGGKPTDKAHDAGARCGGGGR